MERASVHAECRATCSTCNGRSQIQPISSRTLPAVLVLGRARAHPDAGGHGVQRGSIGFARSRSLVLQTMPLKSWSKRMRPPNSRRWLSLRRGASWAKHTNGRHSSRARNAGFGRARRPPARHPVGPHRTFDAISRLMFAWQPCSSSRR